MPGPASSVANTKQGAAFYVNVDTVASGTDTYKADGTTFSPSGVNFTGQVVVRDLGKTIRVPAQLGGAAGFTQRLLRLVQQLDTNARTTGAFPVTNGFVGFNDGVGGAAGDAASNGFETFYIDVSEGKWARLSL